MYIGVGIKSAPQPITTTVQLPCDRRMGSRVAFGARVANNAVARAARGVWLVVGGSGEQSSRKRVVAWRCVELCFTVHGAHCS